MATSSHKGSALLELSVTHSNKLYSPLIRPHLETLFNQCTDHNISSFLPSLYFSFFLSFSLSFLSLFVLFLPFTIIVWYSPRASSAIFDHIKIDFLPNGFVSLEIIDYVFPFNYKPEIETDGACLQQCQVKESGLWRVHLWTNLENREGRKWCWSTTGVGMRVRSLQDWDWV